MDTQEKEKKSEEIAAQTTQTKEQPVPAQPSEAVLKKGYPLLRFYCLCHYCCRIVRRMLLLQMLFV